MKQSAKVSLLNSEEVYNILSAALVGTSLMTAFSYVISEKEKKFFKEPELLNLLLKRIPFVAGLDKNSSAGWIAHYMVGFLFCVLYSSLWKDMKVTKRLSTGLLLGIVSGGIGAVVWKKTLQLHPNPPWIPYKKYYRHIVVAHIVFGGFAAMGYSLPQVIAKISRGRDSNE